MDTRRTYERGARASQPEKAEPEASDVELVELRHVAPPGRGPGARPVFAGAVVALLGLIALTGFAAGPTERLADASGEPEGQASARPAAFAPTMSPPPATPFPWAWTFFESRGYGRGAIAASLWVVGGLFVAEIETDDGPDGGPYGPVSSVLVTSTDGTTWDHVTLPTSGFSIEAGTVVDGRLVLIGRVGTDVAAALQMWSTDDGTWRRMPDPVGLTDFGYVTELAHAGDCRDAPGCEESGWAALVRAPDRSVSDELLVSTDGVRWNRPSLPSPDGATFAGLTWHFGHWYVVASHVARTSLQVFTDVLDSPDGRVWNATETSATIGGGRDLTAGLAGLAMVGRDEREQLQLPYVWLSGNGTSWIEREADMLPGRVPAAMDFVVPTDLGYASMNRLTGDAWISANGELWRNLPAFQAESGDSVAALASFDDVLLAAGRTAAGRPAFWLTSLAGLLATP